MRGFLPRLRMRCALALAVGVWGAAAIAGPAKMAHGAEYESLMVPSAAMGRDIPVAFLGQGSHAVYLLDAFNAHPDVSNWVTVGNAMNTLAGTGISVVAPAGGAYSMYTNWERDGSKQWDTFLSSELPDWLALNRGLAPGGHAVVGAAQGGYAAMALGCFHPDRFGYAGSMSGFLYPASTTENGSITAGMMRFGGVDTYGMWGAPQLGRWKFHDPYQHANLLVQNNSRIWIFSPSGGASDPAAVIGYPEVTAGDGKFFYQQYRYNRGHNGHFDFPDGVDNGWGSWASQLGVMVPDIVGAIG